MSKINIKVELVEEMLGTASANPEIHGEFIAAKAPDAETREEEIAAIGPDAVAEKAMTIFPKFEGRPHLWDYQVKGFIKDAMNALREIPGSCVKGNKRLSKWSYKRTVDNLIFVGPRRIMLVLPEGQKIGKCERPLRAETMRGDRIALASSETVPVGTTFECEIDCLDPTLELAIREALDYGVWKGLGQWRNSGKGRFGWVEVK